MRAQLSARKRKNGQAGRSLFAATLAGELCIFSSTTAEGSTPGRLLAGSAFLRLRLSSVLAVTLSSVLAVTLSSVLAVTLSSVLAVTLG
jgi:hypothetical protein